MSAAGENLGGFRTEFVENVGFLQQRKLDPGKTICGKFAHKTTICGKASEPKNNLRKPQICFDNLRKAPKIAKNNLRKDR